MKVFDPCTFQKVDPTISYKCPQCGENTIGLYDHNGLGKIPPSCFNCMINSADADINDYDIFFKNPKKIRSYDKK